MNDRLSEHLKQSIEDQVAAVQRVKRYENGFIVDPAVLGPNNTIADVDALPFSGVPITDTGEIGGKLVGLVTSRDIDFLTDRTAPLASVSARMFRRSSSVAPR